MTIEIEAQERQILDSIELPPRPKALLTITEEARKENARFPVIAHAIVEDVSISAAVLKVVNSPAFRRPNPISAIDQALSMLGIKRVLAIVNAVAVRNAVKTGVDLEEFWEFGAVAANACTLTAKRLKKMALMDDAYTLGLFHGAGVPVMITRFPDYLPFYRNAEAEGWTLSIGREKEQYGTTHTTLGAVMAQEWNLPEPIVNAIYNLHYADGIFASDELDETSLDLLAILKCGREFARYHLHKVEGNPEWLQVETQVLEYLELDEGDYADLREQVLESLAEQS
jgi:HD-like signal output (HDOD) protein